MSYRDFTRNSRYNDGTTWFRADDSRPFGLHRTSWPRLNGSLSISDSGAFPYSTRQIERTELRNAGGITRLSCGSWKNCETVYVHYSSGLIKRSEMVPPQFSLNQLFGDSEATSADPDHLVQLNQGAEKWNAWRKTTFPQTEPHRSRPRRT